jgi:hypothetical protein
MHRGALRPRTCRNLPPNNSLMLTRLAAVNGMVPGLRSSHTIEGAGPEPPGSIARVR